MHVTRGTPATKGANRGGSVYICAFIEGDGVRITGLFFMVCYLKTGPLQTSVHLRAEMLPWWINSQDKFFRRYIAFVRVQHGVKCKSYIRYTINASGK